MMNFVSKIREMRSEIERNRSSIFVSFSFYISDFYFRQNRSKFYLVIYPIQEDIHMYAAKCFYSKMAMLMTMVCFD